MFTVNDALHRRSASRTGFSEPTVNGHSLVECGHLFRKPFTSVCLKPCRPLRERVNRGRMQQTDLVSRQLTSQLEGRQPRTMKNFIRIRVPDAAEQMGIRQRSLQRVIFSLERFNKGVEACGHHLEAARIDRRQGCFTLQDVKRSSFLRGGLGQQQRAIVEIKRRKPQSSWH